MSHVEIGKLERAFVLEGGEEKKGETIV